MTRFSQAHKFQKSIISLTVGLLGDKNEIDQLKLFFNEIDKENEGFISIDMFNTVLNELNYLPEIDSYLILKQCDLDANGKIDFEEFCCAAYNHQQLLTSKNIQKIFTVFVRNKDK